MNPDPLRAPGTDDEPARQSRHSRRRAAGCLIAALILVAAVHWRGQP